MDLDEAIRLCKLHYHKAMTKHPEGKSMREWKRILYHRCDDLFVAYDCEHVDRGYANLPASLRALGADVHRVA